MSSSFTNPGRTMSSSFTNSGRTMSSSFTIFLLLRCCCIVRAHCSCAFFLPEERRPRRSQTTRYFHFRNYFGKEIKHKKRLTRTSTVLCSQLIFLSQLSFSAVLFFRKQAIVLSGFPLLKCSRFPLDDSSSNNSVPGLVLIPYL